MADQIIINVTTSRSQWLRQFASTRFRRLGQECLWIGLGQAVSVLGAVVGVRVLTGVLPPDAYGKLALGMTVATFANQTVLGPLASGATRFFAPAGEAGTLRSYLAAVRSLVSQASGIILLAAIVLCVGLALTRQFEWIGLSLAAVCFALLSGYNSILDGMQNAARQRAIVALHQGLASWGRFLLAAGIVLVLGAGSTVAMLGYVLAILLVLASQARFFQRTVSASAGADNIVPTEQSRWRAEILAYAWPFAVWGLPAWAQAASDRWALQAFSSVEEVGRYAVLYQLGYYPISVSTGFMVQLVYPVFFQRAGDASDPSRLRHVLHLNRRLTLATLVLTGVAALLAWGLHAPIFRFLVAQEYRAASWMLPGMVLAGGLFATAQFAVISLLSGAQTHKLILPKVVTAVLGAALNILGAVFWGMLGVIAATVIAAAVYLLWVLWLVRAQSREAEVNVARATP